MSLEKMIYDADTGTAIYRSKMPASAAEATGGRGSLQADLPQEFISTGRSAHHIVAL